MISRRGIVGPHTQGVLADMVLLRTRQKLARRLAPLAPFVVVACIAGICFFLARSPRADNTLEPSAILASRQDQPREKDRRGPGASVAMSGDPKAAESCRGQQFSASSLLNASEIQRALSTVRDFVLFLGIQRTGHSLVGSLLDAHPKAVVANEFDVLGWLKGRLEGRAGSLDGAERQSLRADLFDGLLGNSMACAGENRVQAGYLFSVEGQWQGRWSESILVLGDKKGGTSTRMFLADFDRTWDLLLRLQEIVGVPLKIVHVVRNPFDTITTAFLRTSNRDLACAHIQATAQDAEQLLEECRKNARFNSSAVVPQLKLDAELEGSLQYEIQLKLNLMKVNYRLKRRVEHAIASAESPLSASWLDVRLEDLILEPKETLGALCAFLHIPCEENYVAACSRTILPKPSVTRHKVRWPAHLIDMVQHEAGYIDWLRSYSFDKVEG